MATRSSQPQRLSIEELCVKYENENVHTEQVTALALRLFDGTRVQLGLPAKERRLLVAACSLHDLAYAVEPDRHREKSVELVQREGLRGFTESEKAVITGTMWLHAGDLRSLLEHPLLCQTKTRTRLLRLGSFLRIADGLDFSHVQDAAITSVCCEPDRVVVTVSSPAFPANLARADQKADLWRQVWPLDIQFTAPPEEAGRVSDWLTPATPLLEAARRLLWVQAKRLLLNVEGTVRGQDPEALHDLRVANRRLRLLLQIFRRFLPGADELRRDLSQLSSALGPARDLDVWIEFLKNEKARARARARHALDEYLASQIELRARLQPMVQQSLGGPAFLALKLKIGRLLRLELPRLIRAGSADSIQALAAGRLRKALRRVGQDKALRQSQSAEKLHAFRIDLRRARYLSEFFAPVLGNVLRKLARRVRQAEQALGAIHDVDVALERLQRPGASAPSLLVTDLQERRRRSLRKLAKPWKRFANASFRRRLRKCLKAARR